ncbi:MAG TPA: hypothetical protein VKT82_10640 [Ktedonobacterales bacterium]|nr:hypothetical protein [Ktedonobacterales bacterium]
MIEQHYHHHEREEDQQQYADVPRIGGGLQIRAKSGQLKTPGVQSELLGGHQEKPTARPAHHRIPDEPNHAKGHFHPGKALPEVESIR